MTELSGYVFAALRRGEFTLYRGSGDGLDPILLVAPNGEYSAGESVERFEHEHGLKAELNAAWAVRPVDLSRHDGRMALVLEDPGGEPLDRLLGQPMDVTEFLRLAIPLAAALRGMHERNLIHKDIKPANVLVDVASGGVRLTGFGIASRLPRERQAPAPPEIIAGTLAYMAPEQTGRMNRSIDARSDLYSLGITFYEMLTGRLPFTASDPMEWIHCHVARRPTPPSERVAGIPGPLTAIVMKLLAKTAEDRYQTAAGVEADLRRCLAEWQAHRRIEPFPLAAHDVSDRLVIPERLYGREAEIDALLAAFDRVVAEAVPELVLVSGYSGVGKSSVVNEVHKALVAPRGLFAAGKFDQYKRDIPYATLAQAFQSLVRQLLSKDNAELNRWRDALLEALGPNGQLMINLIPELALIIGEQPPVPDLPPQDRQTRFQLAFRRFLGVFARPEHPLALFLDDLQWVDAATLDLLEHLVTQSDVRHLLVIGAYRDNEVGPTHPLVRTLEAIRIAGARVQEIVLTPLRPDDIGQLIADSLHCEREIAQPLAQLVHEKTDGNPFFAIQFFMALADEALLTFDHDAAAWTWDLPRIRAKGFTDNVADLMAAKLSRLPDVTQEAMGQLACLGNFAQIATLTLVHGESEQKVHEGLWEAVRAGLVFRQGDGYAFLHDRVQEAAYTFIPESERAAAHLRIGRSLASRIAPEAIEEVIFDVVNHLNRGAEMIAMQEEREQVAELNLMAGKRAQNASAYASALKYLIAGAALVAEDCWERRYDLAFGLELHRAECEFLIGDLAAAEARLLALSRSAGNLADEAAVTCLRMDLYTLLVQTDRAVAVCLDYLRRAGIEWSPHPTDQEVRQEYERIGQQLGNRSIEELIDLPLMSDPATRATMDVLTKLMPPACMTDENLACLMTTRMVNLSLEHGNDNASCCGYVWLGMMLGPYFGDYPSAFRFGQLSVDLVDKRGLDAFMARVYMNFGEVNAWMRDVRSSRTFVQRAFEAANRVGDLIYAGHCWNNLITISLASGEPLSEAEREAVNGLEFARKLRFGIVVDLITGQLRLIRTLRGLTSEFTSFNDAEFDEAQFEQHLKANPNLALPACFYWIRKLQAHVWANDYSAALGAAAKAQELLWTSRPFFEHAEYHFYAGLARAASCNVVPAQESTPHLEALAAHYLQLEIWARHCPENFEDRKALVAAEIARLEGRALDAERLYEEAIRLARENRFVQNEALGNEHAARFYAARGFVTIADAYLRNAIECSRRWGADGKIRQLEELHPHLRQKPALLSKDGTIGAPVEQLDLATIVEVSQAVSGQIDLRKLINTLMIVALEHAGADRGLLIVPSGEELRIEAEAATVRDAVEVRLRRSSVAPTDLPESVLRYIIRTRDTVLLDDASEQNPYSADEYIRQSHCRSVLCLPLIKQAKLIGVLYLENRLTPRVFTPARISVLRLLASQAAISLENARLYSDVQRENTERKRAEEELRRSKAYLAEAQRLSRTGSFGWSVATGEIIWSDETFRIFGYDTAPSVVIDMVVQRTHPDDRAAVQQTIDRAARDGKDFSHEYRLLMPDGAVKHVHAVAHAVRDASGNIEFFGAVTDVTATRRAEEALRQSQMELAHVTRATTLGELSASIAHEVNQPLAAIVTNGEVCLQWLDREVPDLAEVREALGDMIGNGRRASEIIHRLRALSGRTETQEAALDINEAIIEVIPLVQQEVISHRVSLRLDLAPTLPAVLGDRVQLQQVIINLIVNGMEAMARVTDRPRALVIRSQLDDSGQVLVAVEDSGVGIDPENAGQLFDAFFTTKPGGMGMGLSICRSIVEAHGGTLSASSNSGPGATFQFALQSHQEARS